MAYRPIENYGISVTCTSGVGRDERVDRLAFTHRALISAAFDLDRALGARV